MANGKLTPKQEAFVAEYLADLNATAAAARAGYSDPNIGRQLITKDNVQDAIAQAKAARQQRTQVTADRVVLELARLAFSDPRTLYRPDGTLKPPCEWDDDTAASVSAVETDESTLQVDERTQVTTRTHKVKRWDKLGALDRLGRHLGMFHEKLTLEILFGLLPAGIAGPLREVVGRHLSTRGTGTPPGAGGQAAVPPAGGGAVSANGDGR